MGQTQQQQNPVQQQLRQPLQPGAPMAQPGVTQPGQQSGGYPGYAPQSMSGLQGWCWLFMYSYLRSILIAAWEMTYAFFGQSKRCKQSSEYIENKVQMYVFFSGTMVEFAHFVIFDNFSFCFWHSFWLVLVLP